MLSDVSPDSQGDHHVVVLAALGLGLARSGPAEIQKLVDGADSLDAANPLAQVFVQFVDQERPCQGIGRKAGLGSSRFERVHVLIDARIIVVGIGIGEGMDAVRKYFPIHIVESDPEKLELYTCRER